VPEPPAFTLVTHGEANASFALRDALQEQFKARALVPEIGSVVDLALDNRALVDLVVQQETRPDRSRPAPAQDAGPAETEDQ